MADGAPPPRYLLLSLEFMGPVFSGNGTYSRCLVRGLKAAGAHVLVVSGRKADCPLAAQDPEARAHAADAGGVVDCPLDVWGRVDAGSDWLAFARAAGQARVAERVAAFQPQAVLCVDWHGYLAWACLRDGLRRADSPLAEQVRALYLSFRVYSTSSGLADFERDAPFYRRAEALATAGCAATVALCRTDAVALAALALGRDPVSAEALDARGVRSGGAPPPPPCAAAALDELLAALPAAAPLGGAWRPDIRVLLPPLRSDVAALAAVAVAPAPSPAGADQPPPPPPPPRRYLTSCVRLSPEKGAHRFAALVAALAPTLARLGITPLVCGSVGDRAYADGVFAQLTRAAPPTATIVSAFVGPAELRELFSRTLLNVHGALSDAYGMTLVEAAAFGAPSVVHFPPGPCGGGGGGGGGGGSAAVADEAAAAAAGAGGLAACAAAVSFDRDSAGYLRMSWSAASAAADAGELSRALCAMAFPPVGASDLLAPGTLHAQQSQEAEEGGVVGGALGAPSGGGGGDGAASAALLALDLTAPAADVAAQLAPLLEAAVAAEAAGPQMQAGGGGAAAVAAAAAASGVGSLAATGEAARRVALSWTEADTANALLRIIAGRG
jgi:hypothetical protein